MDTMNELLLMMQKKAQLILNESDISLLIEKESLLLIKSAKDDIVIPFMEYVSKHNYKGRICMIGRDGDEAYKEKYPYLNLEVYAIDSKEKYSVENTKATFNGIQFDGVVLFYRLNISFNYNNLLEIMSKLPCEHFGIGVDFKIQKIENVNEYLNTYYLYGDLIEWLYQYGFEEVELK